MGDKIRVLVADDSAFMRKVLVSILTSDPQIEIAGEARDGREVVAQSEMLKPDVITMDLNMPHMNGLEATEVIMSTQPRPIVVVSSESREGAEPTLRALELGAIDWVAKPTSGVDLDMVSVRDELIRKIRIASKVRVVRNATRARTAATVVSGEISGGNGASSSDPATRNTETQIEKSAHDGKLPVVVLSASTGGPQTLMQLIPMFPERFPGAVLLVQHMPGAFTSQFSAQLDEVANLEVKEAEPGEIMHAGRMYLCPGSHHLRVSNTGRLVLDDGPRINGYKPCADVTLETASAFAGNSTISVVLTGMGNDAARGSVAVKERGGYVIVQDEASAVIFGMPAETIKTGAVDAVVSLDKIYTAIEKRILWLRGAAQVGAL
ncbi:MAG TPA: chemotaxis response regulator protein-glutamate methylesterase [candidate division Zixibacteria bacterium]|nr:chemotaxis response regulator protein-glutamate methylesterase [candidate division Zixibacteria bacterium]